MVILDKNLFAVFRGSRRLGGSASVSFGSGLRRGLGVCRLSLSILSSSHLSFSPFIRLAGTDAPLCLIDFR